MYLGLIFLPFLGSLTSGLLGRKLGVTGAQIVTCACIILSTLMCITAFYEVSLSDSSVYISLNS